MYSIKGKIFDIVNDIHLIQLNSDSVKFGQKFDH